MINLPKVESCFCCGNHNPKGLNMSFQFEGNKVYSEFIPDKEYGVSDYILNPGIAFTVLVEAMGWVLACLQENPAVFLVDFDARVLKPVLIGQKAIVVAEAIYVNSWISETCASISDEQGNMCIKVTGKFMLGKSNDTKVGNHILPNWKL